MIFLGAKNAILISNMNFRDLLYLKCKGIKFTHPYLHRVTDYHHISKIIKKKNRISKSKSYPEDLC